MSYVANAPVPWPLPPDWSEPVIERLEWLTRVIPARNGRVQKSSLRQAPRRSFEFKVLADGAGRRLLDMLLADHGGRYWMLPIWPDVQLLGAPLPALASSIPCRTAGFDFADDGQVLLWLGPNEWSLLTIETVEAEGLSLASASTRDFPAGTRLYPVRRGRLAVQPSEEGWSDDAGARAVTMLIDEPCDWPGELPTTLYRGAPVIELRPDHGEDIASTYARRLEVVDVGTGPVSVFDWVGRSARAVDVRWIAHGRAENAALRSLLYGLAGRWRSAWMPTFNSDLVLAAPVGGSATSLSVEWAGYTLFGRLQPQRRDIRIELWDGTVCYRRITSCAEAGCTETLGIDAALGIDITPAAVRCISFMVFGSQAGDAIELEHITDADGVTVCATRFEGERDDL